DLCVHLFRMLADLSYLNELPKTGEILQAMYREQCFGGKGANQCMAAAKLGANCALIGKLGNDMLGNIYYEYLQQMGINTDYVEQLEGMETGIAQINIDENSTCTIVELPNANLMLNSKDVSNAKRFFNKAKVLVCQVETNHKTLICAFKKFRGVSILNVTMPPIRTELPPELIQAPRILCTNAQGAAALTDRAEVATVQDAKEAAQALIEKGAQSVIITMGPLGAVHVAQSKHEQCQGEVTHCPAAPVRYLADTSGAGDAFVGALAYHILRFPKLCRESHIHAANICAAYAVGHRGTQPSFPGPEIAVDDLCMIQPNFYVIPDETPEEAEQRKQKEAEAANPKTAATPETAPTPVPTIATTPETKAEPSGGASPAPEPEQKSAPERNSASPVAATPEPEQKSAPERNSATPVAATPAPEPAATPPRESAPVAAPA
ncbi:hypothetical protein KR093_001183, partial [Drosophila rubida]